MARFISTARREAHRLNRNEGHQKGTTDDYPSTPVNVALSREPLHV